VIGSVFASLYASRLGDLLPAAIPASVADPAKESVGAALGVAGEASRAGHPGVARAIGDAANSAFFSGFHAGDLVAAGVALAGAVVALALLPSHPPAGATEDDEPTEMPAVAAAQSLR